MGRIEGPLRPRAFACAGLSPSDQRLAEATPIEFSQSDARLFSRAGPKLCAISCETRTGTNCILSIAGRGGSKPTMDVLPYEPGDYILLPKGTTYRIIVEPSPSLFLIIETSALMELP